MFTLFDSSVLGIVMWWWQYMRTGRDVQSLLAHSPYHRLHSPYHRLHWFLPPLSCPSSVTRVTYRDYFQNGQTALSIAQKLGYISVVETLKVVTDTVVTTTTTTTVEEKYKVLAPESMQETFMSDSEDEGGKWDNKISSQPYLDCLVYFITFIWTAWQLA